MLTKYIPEQRSLNIDHTDITFPSFIRAARAYSYRQPFRSMLGNERPIDFVSYILHTRNHHKVIHKSIATFITYQKVWLSGDLISLWGLSNNRTTEFFFLSVFCSKMSTSFYNMVRDARDKSTLYNVDQSIELRRIIDALLPFMRTKEDKDKLRKELSKLDGVTKKVVRETL